jgi:hypothetical protein
MGSLLHKPRLVHDEHAVRIAQALQHIGAHAILQIISAPSASPQQGLHPSRMRKPRLLGQKPAGLALHSGQEPVQEGPGRLANFSSPEHGPDPALEPVQIFRPRGE